jgi:hypothetical protein
MPEVEAGDGVSVSQAADPQEHADHVSGSKGPAQQQPAGP